MNRRTFLHRGALAVAGTAALPGIVVRGAMAQAGSAPSRRLVVVFQRGAADGLNAVVPYAEKNYYALRPGIAIPGKQTLDLDGFFGLHPALAGFKTLYDQGHLAIVHASGSPDATRSHSEAQDAMESGTPGVRTTDDGWLNRALQAEDASSGAPRPSAFRAVAIGAELPHTLAGKIPAIALNNANNFIVGGREENPSPAAIAFERMYTQSADPILRNAGEETFAALKQMRDTNPAQYKPAPGVEYPGTDFGNNMRQIAQLFKANLGVEAAFTDSNGWDTHQNQGGINGPFAYRLNDFASAIAAFWRDLGSEAENVTLVTMSEFGRTARENGTGGTDHGLANAMFVLGGQIKGGKVYGRWPGLADDQLSGGRDLAMTTDYRQVLGEIAAHALGLNNLEAVFPGAPVSRENFLHLV
jgi:uncharacterized protein (DUF1501 family)